MSRTNKGQFKVGNKAAKKKHKSKFIVSNNAAKTLTPNEEKQVHKLVYDYMPFGEDNLFPQRVAELNRKSAVSRSVITSKANYVSGEGFDTDNESFNNWQPNPKETKRTLLNKLALDKLTNGNAYVEVVKVGNEVNFYHKDSTKVRISKDGENAILHSDWENYIQYQKDAIIIPLYPNFERIDGALRSIVHIRSYEQEFNFYGIPSNIAGYDSANINYKTNKWNLSRLENAFNTSGVMMLSADFSEEDAQTFEENFNKKFTGEGQNGKPLMIVNEIGGEPNASKFIPVTSTEDGSWTDLHAQATQEIIVANQWFSSLAGLNVASGFDTDRIKNDYQIAISSVIPNEQRYFIEMFTKVLNEQANFNIEDLSIINTSPISLIDLTNVHQAIIDINTEVQEQRMSEDMAKQVLKLSFQLTEEQVTNLFI